MTKTNRYALAFIALRVALLVALALFGGACSGSSSTTAPLSNPCERVTDTTCAHPRTITTDSLPKGTTR